MSDHIDKTQLRKYDRRELGAGDAAPIVEHLSKCRECLKEYQMMFPEMTNPNQIVTISAGAAGVEEPFHLDFDEHLRTYVDGEIGDIDREIVDGHTKNCGHCAAMLRDLQEFRGRLDAEREAIAFGAQGVWDRVTSFLRVNAGILAFAAVLLAMISAGALYWLSTSNYVAGPTEETPPVQPVVEQLEQNGTTTGVDAGEKTPETVNERDSALAGLSGDERRLVEKAIASNRIQLPGFLTALTVPTGSLRGETEPAKSRRANPNGVALRTRRPEFSWGSAAGETYIVEVYDENFTRIDVSPTISPNRWKPDIDLPQGKIIRWQVKTKDTIVARGSFFVLAAATLRQVSAVEKNPAISPLARAIVYANAGLIPDAKSSLRKYLSSTPDSKLAAELLAQISRAP